MLELFGQVGTASGAEFGRDGVLVDRLGAPKLVL